jgi:predicted ATP-dependent protease
VEDLMLREDVIAAVAAGKFHILPVTTIEQGIEILTGVRAGGRDTEGRFESGTVFALSNDRLSHMAYTLKDFE